MYYFPGEIPSAFSFNVALEGGRHQFDVDNGDPTNHTISIELVPGVSKWNSRAVEFSVDSLTYSRIVASVGEVQARNCLIPVPDDYFSSSGTSVVYLPNILSINKTKEGVPLQLASHPRVPFIFNYEISDNFVFLCGDKDAPKDRYFTGYEGKWENGFIYDQFSKGRIVYVHSGPAGYLVTPTQTDDSFPCIVETPPYCFSWSYNNAFVYTGPEQPQLDCGSSVPAVYQYRFDNRLELLVNLAKHLIKKYLGINPYIAYDYVTDEAVSVVATVSDFDDGTSYLYTQESLAQFVSTAATKDSAAARWLDIVQHNVGSSSSSDSSYSIFHSLQAIKKWVCFSRTCSGVANPTNRYVDQYGGGFIVSDDEIRCLGDVVNNTPELKKATALNMVVTPIVPGRNYTTYSDPIVEKLSPTTEQVEGLETKVLWGGDRLIPFSKETPYYRSQTQDLVKQYNSKSEHLQTQMDRLSKEMSSYADTDVAFPKAETVSLPQEPPQTFIPVAQRGEVGSRKLATVLTPIYISETLGITPVVSPLSGRKQISYSSLPTDLYKCYLSPILVVDRGVDQYDWLMILYCFSSGELLSQTIDETGKKRIYELFDGTDCVLPDNESRLRMFIDRLNAASQKSVYLPSGFDNGFSHEKNGGFWRSLSESPDEDPEDSEQKYEYYPFWYDIVENKFVTPWKDSASIHRINVVYACDIVNDSYKGDEFALYKVEEKKNENGAVIGYIITEGASPSRANAYSVKARLMEYSDLLGVLSGIPETLQDTSVEKIDIQTGSITKAKHVQATYSHAATNKTDPKTSVPSSGTRFTEFVYQPPKITETVPQKNAELATVRLPITSLLIPKLDVPPRFDSLLCSAKKPSLTAYSYFVSKSLGLVELPDSKPTYQEAFYSFEDMIRPFCRIVSLQENKEHLQEIIEVLSNEGYSNINVISYKPFKTPAPDDSGESGGSSGGGESSSQEEDGGFWSWVFSLFSGWNDSYLFSETGNNSGNDGVGDNEGTEGGDGGDGEGGGEGEGDGEGDGSEETSAPVEYICFGTYEPGDIAKPDKIYFDLVSQSMPLYVQRVDAVSTNDAYVHHVPFKTSTSSGTGGQKSPGDSDQDESSSDAGGSGSGYSFWDWIRSLMKKSTYKPTSDDTCGWIRYRYFDELETNQVVEKVRLPVPAILGSDVEISDNKWVVHGNKYDPVMFTPFWGKYKMSYGYAETESIDPNTLEATIVFCPYRNTEDSTGEQSPSEDPNQEDDGGFWSWVMGILDRAMASGTHYLFAETGEDTGNEDNDGGNDGNDGGDDGTGGGNDGSDGGNDGGESDGDDGTGDSGTGDSGTGDSGTGDSGTGDSGTGTSPSIPHIDGFNRFVPRYDQYFSFPYATTGYPPFKRTRLTTKTYKAHRSDWVPAICKTLDHNEVLIPGMVVPIEEATTIINGETFRYMIVTPPESYSTVLEGTPEQVVYKITYCAPSPHSLEDEIIKEDDCWITGIKKLEDDELPLINPPGGTVYRFGVNLDPQTAAPKITEPFGAFNNCDNKGSLTAFLRTTAWGISYTCTARLDYIPFGYAVPSKTPSCYYKTVNDDCAVHMVGPRYLVKRIESDNRLCLTGACYVPCSTLSSFN